MPLATIAMLIGLLQGADDTAIYQGPPLPPANVRKSVAYIESHVKLPKAAHRLGEYSRYYAQKGGIVTGIYLLELEPAAPKGIHILESADDLPGWMDGGCSMITVTYLPANHHLDAECNGEA